MASTHKFISAVTVGSGGVSNIEFTSIPNTYTDLVVKLSLRQTSTSGGAQLGLRFNGDTGNNYTRNLIYADHGGIVNIAGGTNEPYARFAFEQSSNYTASTFGNFQIYIPNYAGNKYKSFQSDSVNASNSSSFYATAIYSGFWNSAAAITNIHLQNHAGGNNFAEHSTAYLYGISNA